MFKKNFTNQKTRKIVIASSISGIIAVLSVGAIFNDTSIGLLKENESNIQEISILEFNQLPNFIAELKLNNTDYIIRGYYEGKKLAFNDYKNNNTYFFEDYSVSGALQDFIVTNEDIFMINQNTHTIDRFSFDSGKPVVTSSINVEGLDMFIGADLDNNTIFVKTIHNDVFAYSITSNEIFECKYKGESFNKIYNDIALKGDIFDFFFVEDFLLDNGERGAGILISQHEEKIIHNFYKQNEIEFIKIEEV